MKYILPVFLCLFIAMSLGRLQAQTVDVCPAIPEGEFAEDATIEVPVLVSGFDDVAAFQFTVDFPVDLLAFEGLDNSLGQVQFNEAPAGALRVSWVSLGALGVDLPNESVLVTLQFTLSIILIVSVIVVFEQIQFTQNKNLGYEKDNVLIMDIAGSIYRDIVVLTYS